MTAVRLLLPQNGLLRWHRALVERLAADGHRVQLALRPRRGEPPSLTQLIEILEEWAQRRRRPAATLGEPPGSWCAADDGEADLDFDLTGSAEAKPGAIVPLYDGAVGDAARDAALLDGRAPWIELAAVGDDGPRVYASALPVLPSRDRLVAGRADIAAAVAVLIRGLARSGPGEAPTLRPASATPTRGALAGAAASLSDLIARRLRRLVVNDGHWRIGLRRRAPGETPFAGLDRLEDSGWRWLDDDRRRYFADPFLFEEGDVDYVFCEEFPYATGKGVISVFTLDEAGNPGSPSVALERPLSPLLSARLPSRRSDLDDARERRQPHARTLPRRTFSRPLDARLRLDQRRRVRRRDAVRLERRVVADGDDRRDRRLDLGQLVALRRPGSAWAVGAGD
jgi:hypothetical protein